MPRQLTISPTPFKSSFLSIPPSPFSPRLPITPAVTTTTVQKPTHKPSPSTIKASASLVPPPPEPLHWLWQCHKCNRVYQLGVTRRCLDDGHFFCAGSTVIRRSKRNGYKRTARHAACASEFDYQGWKGRGVWRRGVVERVEAAEKSLREEEGGEESEEEDFLGETISAGRCFDGTWSRKGSRGGESYWGKEGVKPLPPKLKKDCWNRCDYPSECRWGKQFGVQTPVQPTTVIPSTPVEAEPEPAPLPAPTTEKEKKPATTFEELLIDITDPASVDYLAPLSPTNSHSPEVRRVTEGETKMTSPYDLVQSAKRRKRESSGAMPLVPSPLALNPPSPEEEEMPKGRQAIDEQREERRLSSPLKKSLDDLDLAVMERGRKGGLVDMNVLQRRADDLMQSWRYAKAKFQSGAL